MIKTKTFNVKGRSFTRTYSSRNMMIFGGVPEDYYTDACDPTDLGRTYTETDIPIEQEEDDG